MQIVHGLPSCGGGRCAVSIVSGMRKEVYAEVVLVKEIKVLEILKRAQSGGEIVSCFESESNVKEEVLKRNAKAGAGKGDKPRPTDKKLYDENYVKIFGHN